MSAAERSVRRLCLRFIRAANAAQPYVLLGIGLAIFALAPLISWSL